MLQLTKRTNTEKKQTNKQQLSSQKPLQPHKTEGEKKTKKDGVTEIWEEKETHDGRPDDVS